MSGDQGTAFASKRAILIFAAAAILLSLFFRVKLALDLPAGTDTTAYGLYGFDDEPSHLAYALFLLEHGTLPLQAARVTDSDAFQRNEFEYHQPPLYYAAVAGLCRLLGLRTEDEVLAAGRMLNVILCIASLWVFHRILSERDLRPPEAAALTGFCALIGSGVFQGTVFGNDAMSWLLLWTAFLLILKGVDRNTVPLVAVLTLAHYTKSTAVLIYPVLLWAVWEEMRRAGSVAFSSRHALLLALPLLLAGPWYARNLSEYGAFIPFGTIAGDGWQTLAAAVRAMQRLAYLPHGLFFGIQFDPPKPLLGLLNKPFYIWSAWAALVWIIRLPGNWRRDAGSRLSIILIASVAAGFLLFSLSSGYAEARFLFPAMPALLSIYSDGLRGDKPPDRSYHIIGLIIASALIALGFVYGFSF